MKDLERGAIRGLPPWDIINIRKMYGSYSVFAAKTQSGEGHIAKCLSWK